MVDIEKLCFEMAVAAIVDMFPPEQREWVEQVLREGEDD